MSGEQPCSLCAETGPNYATIPDPKDASEYFCVCFECLRKLNSNAARRSKGPPR